jgi:hypothetical protein
MFEMSRDRWPRCRHAVSTPRGKSRSRAAADRQQAALVGPQLRLALAFIAAPGTVGPNESDPYSAGRRPTAFRAST